jgi:hypothetical protein
MPAGERKIPEPIVEPTRTAIALHNPSRRGSEEARANVESAAADREEESVRIGSGIRIR